MRMTQKESDQLVSRVKLAVEKYGGQSEELAELRKYYEMVHRCPEHGAMVACEAELNKLGC